MSLSSYTRQSESYLADKTVHERWADRYLNPDLDAFYDAAFGRLAGLLRSDRQPTILDAGCGYGFHTVRLARHGFRVVGVDLSEAALSEARKRVEGAGLGSRVELRRGDLLALPFGGESFDAVMCWGVLMHIPEVERALAELARVLAPGGRMAIAENNQDSIHVQTWDRAIPAMRHLMGKPGRQVEQTPRGREEWREGGSEGVHGGMLVRKANVGWLADRLAAHGVTAVAREAGQFTEIYTVLPWRFARKTVHAFNYWWFRSVRRPGPALGNILVFEKRPPARTAAAATAPSSRLRDD